MDLCYVGGITAVGLCFFVLYRVKRRTVVKFCVMCEAFKAAYITLLLPPDGAWLRFFTAGHKGVQLLCTSS